MWAEPRRGGSAGVGGEDIEGDAMMLLLALVIPVLLKTVETNKKLREEKVVEVTMRRKGAGGGRLRWFRVTMRSSASSRCTSGTSQAKGSDKCNQERVLVADSLGNSEERDTDAIMKTKALQHDVERPPARRQSGAVTNGGTRAAVVLAWRGALVQEEELPVAAEYALSFLVK